MGICVEIFGQGCCSLESFGNIEWFLFIFFFLDEFNEFKVICLDVVYDDYIGILDKFCLKLDIDDGNYCLKFCFWEILYGSCGFLIYYGSK